MGNPAAERNATFTYRQYCTWPDDERWELINGVAWNMSPAPLTNHQRIVRRIYGPLVQFLEGKPCEAFDAPFDVLFPRGDEEDDLVDTVVQPDILVYCDRSRITRRGGRGAPDLVVEILSPSTSRKDQKEKFDLYENRGVREYWVVDPKAKWLCVYRRGSDGKFDEGELREEEREFGSIESAVLTGFSIDPKKIFAED
jgi:Uma2 family endonuclease